MVPARCDDRPKAIVPQVRRPAKTEIRSGRRRIAARRRFTPPSRAPRRRLTRIRQRLKFPFDRCAYVR